MGIGVVKISVAQPGIVLFSSILKATSNGSE